MLAGGLGTAKRLRERLVTLDVGSAAAGDPAQHGGVSAASGKSPSLGAAGGDEGVAVPVSQHNSMHICWAWQGGHWRSPAGRVAPLQRLPKVASPDSSAGQRRRNLLQHGRPLRGGHAIWRPAAAHGASIERAVCRGLPARRQCFAPRLRQARPCRQQALASLSPSATTTNNNNTNSPPPHTPATPDAAHHAVGRTPHQVGNVVAAAGRQHAAAWYAGQMVRCTAGRLGWPRLDLRCNGLWQRHGLIADSPPT